MAFALAMALVGGATFALFTDSDSNDGNTFSAGTVEIAVQRNASEPTPGPMFYTTTEEGMGDTWQTDENNAAPGNAHGLWKPGDSHSAEMTVFNKGSLSAKITHLGAEISGDPDFINDTAAKAEFSKYLNVKIERLENGSSDQKVYITLFEGALSQLLAEGGAKNFEADPKVIAGAHSGNISSQHLLFTCSLSKDAGDALQGKKPVVSFYLIAQQAKNN